MRAAAAADGIDLVAFSSFRDFDRQLAIWNGKFRGERPMQDRSRPAARRPDLHAGRPRRAPFSGGRRCRVRAVTTGARISMCSTRAPCPPGTSCRWCRPSTCAGGPFHRLTTWLDAHMHAFGFFRPYTTDRGGVQPEPWHLSLCAGGGACAAPRSQSKACGRCSRTAAIDGKSRSARGARPQLCDLRGQRGPGTGRCGSRRRRIA